VRLRPELAVLLLFHLAACGSGERPHPNTSVAPSAKQKLEGLPPARTHPSGRLVTATPAPNRPFGIAISLNGVVYCTLLDAGKLIRTDLAAAPPIMVGVGRVPTDVAFDPAGTWAFVTNQKAQTIGMINVRTNTQVAAVPVEGDPFRVVVGPEGQVVYATTNDGSLVQLDPALHAVSWAVQLGGNLNGLAINRAGTRIFVGDVNGTVYEVNPSGDIVRSLAVPGRPQGLALSSREDELYVAGEAGFFISLDLRSGTEIARTPLGAAAFGIAVTPDQHEIWITAPGAGKVFVVDGATRTLRKTIDVGGMPRRVAFDGSGSTAVIADEAGSIRFVR
jgi:YVTN family beta-propeller protein